MLLTYLIILSPSQIGLLAIKMLIFSNATKLTWTREYTVIGEY